MATLYCAQETALAEFLRKQYGEVNGRFPGLTSDHIMVRIDDRRVSDCSLDFCEVTVLVSLTSRSNFVINLKKAPVNEVVIGLVHGKDGTIVESEGRRNLRIALSTAEVTFLRRLAVAIRHVPGRGRSYLVPNWKWVAPRTADSLQRFADTVMEYRKGRQSLGLSGKRTEGPSHGFPGRSTGIPKPEPSVTPCSVADDEEDIFRRLELG